MAVDVLISANCLLVLCGATDAAVDDDFLGGTSLFILNVPGAVMAIPPCLVVMVLF